jgi:hypothetical protein
MSSGLGLLCLSIVTIFPWRCPLPQPALCITLPRCQDDFDPSPSGYQNMQRNTGCECTIARGTFRAQLPFCFLNVPWSGNNLKSNGSSLYECSINYSTFKARIAPRILTTPSACYWAWERTEILGRRMQNSLLRAEKESYVVSFPKRDAGIISHNVPACYRTTPDQSTKDTAEQSKISI